MKKKKVTDTRRSIRTSVGGSSNELGSHFRATIAAWVAAHGLVGRALPLIAPSASSGIPAAVHLETSDELDDIRVVFVDGCRAQLQAKHSLTLAATSKPLQSTIKQWRAALANSTLDSDKTSLVLATAQASTSVRALASALKRKKDAHPGANTKAETDALARAKTMLNVPDREFAMFCSMAVVVELPTTATVAAIDHIAIELLDGRVVAAGEGSNAWPALVEHAHELARRRAGDSIPGWLAALRKRKLTLVADANASVAARLEAERLAVRRHRDRLIDAARLLDLRGLGVALPPLSIEIAIDDIRVHSLDAQTDSADRERTVVGALRRRGHSLLAGPPGSGKSTALTQAAAEWARHDEWPIPVQVKLTEFVRALAIRAPLDALLEAAMQCVPADDHVVLRSAMEREIRSGNVALFLDALDETREKRFDVVRHLDRLMKHELRQVTEVVLSTRDSAYADATTLGFRPIKMAAPRNVASFIASLLTSIAEKLGIDSSSKAEWILTRQTWVTDFIERDPTLQETPLMPLLLVLLAVENASGAPPRGRVEILSSVVDNVVRRWEVRQRRTADVRIGPLEGEAATTALLQCFALIGWNLINEHAVRKAEAEAAVASAFRESWGLASGHATVSAREALHFWDDAGVYVFGGGEESLAPRVMLLAEVGASRYLLSLDRDRQKQGVSELVTKKTARTTLSLAMSANASITSDVIQAAIDRVDTDLLLWCADQIRSGAATVVDDLAHLASVLLSRKPVSNAEAWKIAKVLCRLRIPSVVRNRLQGYLRILTAPQQVIAEAMLATEAGQDLGNVDLLLSAVAREARPDGQLSRPPGSRRVLTRPDDDVESFAVTLAERLLKTRPETAELFAEIAKSASFSTHDRLWKLIEQAGRSDLLPKDHRDFLESMKRFTEDGKAFHELWRKFLSQIRALAVPSELSIIQRRRLDDLADFVATLSYSESIPKEIWRAFADEIDLPWLFRTTAILAGFDLQVLAAQAEIALGMKSGYADSMSFLFDAANPRELLHWNLHDPLSTIQRLVNLVGSTHWVSRTAVSALENAPLKHETAMLLEQKLKTYGPYQRLHAGWLITTLEPASIDARLSRWKNDNDPILRRLAAINSASAQSPTDVEWAFNDGDESVRSEAVERVSKRADVAAFTVLLQSVASSEPRGWLCLWCGVRNEAAHASHGCSGCQTSPPDGRRSAQDLLKKMGVEFKRPKTPVNRILSREDLLSS